MDCGERLHRLPNGKRRVLGKRHRIFSQVFRSSPSPNIATRLIDLWLNAISRGWSHLRPDTDKRPSCTAGMPARAVLGQGHQSRLLERQRRPRVSKAAQRLFFGSAWLMPVIQAAVVASRSKDPNGCRGLTFLSKLDMDASVVGFTVLDII